MRNQTYGRMSHGMKVDKLEKELKKMEIEGAVEWPRLSRQQPVERRHKPREKPSEYGTSYRIEDCKVSKYRARKQSATVSLYEYASREIRSMSKRAPQPTLAIAPVSFALELNEYDHSVCQQTACDTFTLQQSVMHNFHADTVLQSELQNIYNSHDSLVYDSATCLSAAAQKVKDAATQQWLDSRSTSEKDMYLKRSHVVSLATNEGDVSGATDSVSTADSSETKECTMKCVEGVEPQESVVKVILCDHDVTQFSS